MDDTSDEPASAQNADQISVKSQDSPEPYDIAALMREIQNSNRLQEQLLSRVQVALKVKVPAAENETQSPLADVSEEDWEELSRAGQSLLKAHSLTWNYGEDEKYKEVSGKLDAALKVFLKQFERPTKDLSKMTRAIRNRHQQGQRQPELLIPNPKKGVLKIGWCPPPARLTDNIGESQKQDEFEGAVKSAIEGIRSNWAVSERAKSVVEVINLDYDRSGYPVDIVWRHSKKHLSGIMGFDLIPRAKTVHTSNRGVGGALSQVT
ncbi:hypothetical protein BU16DRAFT_340006 [Lophium mytilinum]|uniref:Uncharacterized protein n=1 Tax=Lophium mytilinum TaxID=390894 RepID=A0A6A6QYJ1_9PEZI|nr:hypothetical protein BU16DRAFT_340006 [Lophium mytilinum]